MTTYKLQAPLSFPSGQINGVSGATYTLASDRTVSSVDQHDVAALLASGFCFFNTFVNRISVNAPLADASANTVYAATTPANGAKSVAAQPPEARKLIVTVHVGTSTTTAITAGTLTFVGVDQDGNALTEVISLIANSSTTVTTVNAYATITSMTVAGYVASGSGTGNTIAIGMTADLGMPTGPGVTDFVLLKATKITNVLGTSVVAADDVASTATVDAVARTVAPTTAFGAAGVLSYEFTYSYSLSH